MANHFILEYLDLICSRHSTENDFFRDIKSFEPEVVNPIEAQSINQALSRSADSVGDPDLGRWRSLSSSTHESTATPNLPIHQLLLKIQSILDIHTE
ncbi:MAG TPA: hypothetical protein VHD33_08380, partial [Legionellaceae bacterium]|nr:hypothetical protein [Legionellaceae bacterium]